MKKEEAFEKAGCPLRVALNAIGGKWKFPILCVISNGPKRYGEIKDEIPEISGVMLSQSLKELEAIGLIRRVQYNEIPPRVEYSLGETSDEIGEALSVLQKWGKKLISQEIGMDVTNVRCCDSCPNHKK